MNEEKASRIFGELVGSLRTFANMVEAYLSLEADVESNRISVDELLDMSKRLGIYSKNLDVKTLHDSLLSACRQELWESIMQIKSVTDEYR